MTPDQDGFVDERRTAPAVREWSSLRREATQLGQDRTALARRLHVAGLSRVEIADILGVHWAAVGRILRGAK